MVKMEPPRQPSKGIALVEDIAKVQFRLHQAFKESEEMQAAALDVSLRELRDSQGDPGHLQAMAKQLARTFFVLNSRLQVLLEAARQGAAEAEEEATRTGTSTDTREDGRGSQMESP